MVKFQLADEAKTQTFATQFAEHCPGQLVMFLSGTLGAGKTTLVRGILRGLGYHGTVKSPTYTIVEPYHFNDLTIYHFDLYRISDAEELEFIGIRDYFHEQAICFIEWPENASSVLPQADLVCNISILDEGRYISMDGYSKQGIDLIKRLQPV